MPSVLGPVLALLLVTLPGAGRPPDVALDASRAAPGTHVGFARLPAITDTLRGEVRAAGLAPFPAFTDSTADGRASVVVPLHPDVLTGGDVALAVFDGTRLLGVVEPFRIGALPRAPGTLDRTAAAQRGAVEAHAALYGLGADALRQPDADLPVQLWPAAIALGALDSLGARVAALDPAEREVADALAAALGLDETLAAHAATLGSFVPDGPVRSVPEAGGASGTGGGAPRGPSAPRAPFDPSLNKVNIRDTDDLSDWMQRAESQRKIAESLVVKAVGDLNGLVGTIPIPQVQVATLVVGSVLFLAVEEAAIEAAILPSSLVSPSAAFTKTAFDEDDGEPGSWQQFEVSARSRSWNVAESLAKLLLEGALATRSIGTMSSSRGGLADALQGMADMVQTTWAKNRLAEIARDAGAGAVVGPFTWGPFPISDPRYSTALPPIGSDVVVVDTSAHTYTPVGVGQAVIQLRPRGDAFPPASNARAARFNQTVEVRAMRVWLDPGMYTGEPGEIVSITAHVDNALDPSVTWSGATSTGPTTAQVVLPEHEETIYVTATSAATGGARNAPDAPERSALGGYTGREEEEVVDDIPLCLAEHIQSCMAWSLDIQGVGHVAGDRAMAHVSTPAARAIQRAASDWSFTAIRSSDLGALADAASGEVAVVQSGTPMLGAVVVSAVQVSREALRGVRGGYGDGTNVRVEEQAGDLLVEVAFQIPFDGGWARLGTGDGTPEGSDVVNVAGPARLVVRDEGTHVMAGFIVGHVVVSSATGAGAGSVGTMHGFRLSFVAPKPTMAGAFGFMTAERWDPYAEDDAMGITSGLERALDMDILSEEQAEQVREMMRQGRVPVGNQ